MTRNLAHLAAIELIAAAQGIEFRRPLHSSPLLERVHAQVRAVSPALGDDRPLGPEIEALAALLLDGALVD
jgi:histidine ammonia-lyase